jgi:hypothetical protein
VFYLKQNQTNKKPQGLNEGKEKEEEKGKNKKENKIKGLQNRRGVKIHLSIFFVL